MTKHVDTVTHSAVKAAMKEWLDDHRDEILAAIVAAAEPMPAELPTPPAGWGRRRRVIGDVVPRTPRTGPVRFGD